MGGNNDVPLGSGEDEIKLYDEVKHLNKIHKEDMKLIEENRKSMVYGFVPKPPHGYQEL
jgi:hypothetical protein